MNAILQFFEGIGTAIKSVFDFIISFFGDLVYLVQLTARFLGSIRSYFTWIPTQLASILFVIFAIVVLYKVLGREG